MSQVELRPYIDGNIPARGASSRLLQAGRADVEVVFLERVGERSGRVEYPVESGNEVVAPLAEGTYFVGYLCPAMLGADGRVAMVYPPLEWGNPEKGLAVGDAVRDAQERMEERRQEIERIRSEFDEFVPGVDEELLSLRERADDVEVEMAQQKADTLEAHQAAMNAESLAESANTTALDAAGIAADKGYVLIQDTTPEVKYRTPETLWIDTTSGDNTPKRWSGTAWVAVTDKKAIEAAAAAATASQNATLAMQSADKKSTITYSTSTPVGPKAGDRWYNSSTGKAQIWSGTAWRDTTPGEGFMPTLDIGRATAGSLEVGRLSAANTEFGTSVINNLVSNSAFLGRLYANQIVVAPTDFAPGPGGYESAYTLMSGASIASPSLDPTGKYIRISPAASPAAERAAWGPLLPVRPGEKISFEAYATYGGTSPNTDWSTAMYWYGADGVTAASGGERTFVTTESASGGSTGWSRGVVEVPEGAAFARARFYSALDAEATGYRGFRNFNVKKQVGAILLEDGVVAAEKLAATIALVSEIIAGPETGAHAKLDQTGFHAYRPTIEGTPAEVISLGVDGSTDYLSIQDAQGDTLSNLDDVGGIYGKEMGAPIIQSEDIYLAGDHLSTWVPRYGIRPVAVVSAPGSFWNSTSQWLYTADAQWKPLADVAWENSFDHTRLVWLPPVAATFRLSETSGAHLRWYYTLDGATPTEDDTLTGVGQYDGSIRGSDYFTIETAPAYVEVPEGATFTARLFVATRTTANIRMLSTSEVTAQLWDVGPASFDGAGRLYNLSVVGGGGSGGDSSSKQTYTRTWSSTGRASYRRSNGSRNSFWNGKAVQGTYSEALRGVAIFANTITSALSGSTISKVEVYVKWDHTYYSSGATARVGAHGMTALPSSHSSDNSGVLASRAIGKGAGAWITLPSSTHTHWLSGAYKGIILLGSSTADYGYATDVRIRITYRK